MEKFKGKKLLVLGTSVASVEIVEYAKSQGAYVIVTDYLPKDKSKAKMIADETAMISTIDVPALCKFAREKKVDGVFCGVSEVNLVSVQRIAEELNLPCYFTEKQWNQCQDKVAFHKLCEKYQIPVSHRYDFDSVPTNEQLANIRFPVIVKPVDQGAGIGIHICTSKEELLSGYADAYEKSHKHQVIVEDYIVGDEFSAAYNIIDGEFKLSIMGDKYLNREQEGLLPLPEAYVYPSKHLALYERTMSPKVIQMFKSIGLKNGTVFVQGITDGKRMVLFEAGLRMGGTALFRFVGKVNDSNIVEMLTNYSLSGKMDGDISKEDPALKGKRCCILSLLNKGGTIEKIIGVEEAKKVNGVYETIVRYDEGDNILKSGTLKQSHIRFFVVRDTAYELKESIDKIQQLISVLDEEGKDMLLSSFDTKKLLY